MLPLSQLDLEKVLATSKKTQAAAGEYCGLRWSREPDEVEAAISGISKLLVSQFINLQSGSQDKTIHCASIFVVSREIVALHIRVLELLEDGDIRSIKPFEILKLLNLNSDSSEGQIHLSFSFCICFSGVSFRPALRALVSKTLPGKAVTEDWLMPSEQRGSSLTGTGRRPAQSLELDFQPCPAQVRVPGCIVHTAAANMRVMRKETIGNDDIIVINICV
ncbi:hypothetical protein Bca52824_052832 [Brassica carinata]|uniref:Uncharacterized protein n=1 Tax=Brassica carinata TaxID=52824 RepID=A0A8X7UK16_BRACI|nr:hypothetical protein Bca52824_052832 [Brassica carinata]